MDPCRSSQSRHEGRRQRQTAGPVSMVAERSCSSAVSLQFHKTAHRLDFPHDVSE